MFIRLNFLKKKTNDFEKNSTRNNTNRRKFRKRFKTNQKIEKKKQIKTFEKKIKLIEK